MSILDLQGLTTRSKGAPERSGASKGVLCNASSLSVLGC